MKYDELYTKYPHMFQNRHKSIQESCMAFGVECGVGWFKIISNLCHQIDQHEKNITNEKNLFGKSRYNKDYEPVQFDQIKEKFGGLRVYHSGGDDFVYGLVSMAESMSYCTCESCGNKGEVNKQGWIRTLCENCRNEK